MQEHSMRAPPLVSVVMANFEAGSKIVPALRSVLGQSLGDLEIIVSDDGSRDDSMALVRQMMAEDDRIRLVTAAANGGPARCRNRALEVARGDWIAIVDSDDIIHPERFERLLAAAASHHADIVADDLLLFFEDGSAPRLMLGDDAGHAFLVPTERWLLGGLDGSPALGYLKPLIRTSALRGLRYDENLRIGEDHDLVLRLLLGGARMLVVPEPFYLYRRHSGSISHRLSVHDLEAMIDRQAVLLAGHGALGDHVTSAFARREAALRRGLGYERLVKSLKGRRPGAALGLLARDPTHLGRLWNSFIEGRRRRVRTAPTIVSPMLQLGGHEGIAVPDYVPVAMTDWAAARPRQPWLDLAAQRGLGPVRCIALDAAGRYAAGFIPEAEIAAPERVREMA
ncbi:glycosyl transferase family A [Nostoc sp. 3335mG]|nr:glycosyl transferase family A [Nostoc sp. 3335mG]